MKRWLPYPFLTAVLLPIWLLLNQTVSLGHVVLGAALALGGGLAFAGLQTPGHRLRRAAAVPGLLWLLVEDIMRSNLAVARIVLHPGTPKRTAGFLSMPLQVRHPGALAVMACIITATPGTSWARYDASRNVLTIHVLDLVDEEAWIRLFKQRYERRLQEIFE
ncbi:MAG TPA: Na+/H+ antiporter subunit E [Burkholderiales bacterium]|nr:Na+/H+ antiporter subunit E [Burkholderiales bacterium]